MVHFQSSTMDAVHVILFNKLDKINYLTKLIICKILYQTCLV